MFARSMVGLTEKRDRAQGISHCSSSSPGCGAASHLGDDLKSETNVPPRLRHGAQRLNAFWPLRLVLRRNRSPCGRMIVFRLSMLSTTIKRGAIGLRSAVNQLVSSMKETRFLACDRVLSDQLRRKFEQPFGVTV